MSSRFMLNISSFIVLYFVLRKASKEEKNKKQILLIIKICFILCLFVNFILIWRIHIDYAEMIRTYLEQITKKTKT